MRISTRRRRRRRIGITGNINTIRIKIMMNKYHVNKE